MNGYENNCDVESWIQDKADREFYISQAKPIFLDADSV